VGAVLGDPAWVSCNREVLYADSLAPEALVVAGTALPLFGARRLVVVRGLGTAVAKGVERLRLTVAEARARPEGWPTEGTTVVFVAPGIDRRSPVRRLLPEPEQVELRPPTGRAVVGWLRERARQQGLHLAPDAAETLLALVGEELSRLATEIDKAALLVGEDGRVTEAVVRALVGESRVRQYWELTQALEGGDRGTALRLLEQLLAAGEEPLGVLAVVVGYLRDLWRIHGGLAAGKDARALGGLLPRRRPEFAVERLMRRATMLGLSKTADGVRRCFEVERRLKSAGGSPRALLTALVADLARE
jgi:DNA polymerase-3 subunit delta